MSRSLPHLASARSALPLAPPAPPYSATLASGDALSAPHRSLHYRAADQIADQLGYAREAPSPANLPEEAGRAGEAPPTRGYPLPHYPPPSPAAVSPPHGGYLAPPEAPRKPYASPRSHYRVAEQPSPAALLAHTVRAAHFSLHRSRAAYSIPKRAPTKVITSPYAISTL